MRRILWVRFRKRPQFGTRVSKQLRPSNSRANLGFIDEFLELASSFLFGSDFGEAEAAEEAEPPLLGVKEGTEEESLTNLPRSNSAAKASKKLNMEFIFFWKLVEFLELLFGLRVCWWGVWWELRNEKGIL